MNRLHQWFSGWPTLAQVAVITACAVISILIAALTWYIALCIETSSPILGTTPIN